MRNKGKRIVLLCSACFSTNALYNYLSTDYQIERIIMEDPLRGAALVKRRLKRLGFFRVMGQVLFSVIIVRLVSMTARKRVRQIIADYGMDDTGLPAEKITHFHSVNDEKCIALLKELQPDIVLVNGTRILSKQLLSCTGAVFINMHTGITPAYRGVHGGYWAVVNNDIQHCGVTIHLVDKGIDTGAVLYQSQIKVTAKDNFVTYPYLQFGAGIPFVHKAIGDAVNNTLRPLPPGGEKGKLWYHPTIWQYLYYRIVKNRK